MVIIRLQRRGTKKTPDHRIVVADKAHSQAGRVLETLGHYNPAYEPPKLTLNQSRLSYWVSTGAQISPAVSSLVKRIKKAPAAPRA